MQATVLAELTTPLLVGIIVGGVLALLGVLWIFMMTWFPPKDGGPHTAGADNPIVIAIQKFFELLTKLVGGSPKTLYPGFIMLLVGAATVITCAGFAAWGSKGGSGGTNTPTTTTAPGTTTTGSTAHTTTAAG